MIAGGGGLNMPQCCLTFVVRDSTSMYRGKEKQKNWRHTTPPPALSVEGPTAEGSGGGGPTNGPYPCRRDEDSDPGCGDVSLCRCLLE